MAALSTSPAAGLQPEEDSTCTRQAKIDYISLHQVDYISPEAQERSARLPGLALPADRAKFVNTNKILCKFSKATFAMDQTIPWTSLATLINGLDPVGHL